MSIANANEVTSAVTRAGMLSAALSLPNTLLVSSLSHKLFYVSQINKELNCIVLIYFRFFLIQNIFMNEIIGRGNKRGTLLRGKLYYRPRTPNAPPT